MCIGTLLRKTKLRFHHADFRIISGPLARKYLSPFADIFLIIKIIENSWSYMEKNVSFLPKNLC